jgi:hypothetical protein
MSLRQHRNERHSAGHAGARFNLPRKILRVERDQKADGTRIDNAITQAESEIAALRRRPLGPRELQRSINAIRDRIILTVRDVRQNMVKRTIAAKNMEGIVDDGFLCWNSRFSANGLVDEKLRARFFELFASTPTSLLIHHLHDAIDAGNFTCAENIRFEFQCRKDRQEYAAAFDMILEKNAFRDPVEMRKRLANILKAAEEADARITDLLRQVHWSLNQSTE